MYKRLSIDELPRKSEELRNRMIESYKRTGRGHIASSLSAVEILTTIYYGLMKDNDSFILSKGHASGILYTVLNDLGFIPNERINSLEEHPKFNKDYHITASTGSLGHGLSIGAGIAFADRANRTYVLLGDGECDEGQVWEAARLASELKLKNLSAVVDCNGFQGFKSTDYALLNKKFLAFGWSIGMCGGHDCEAMFSQLNTQYSNPFVLFASTIKGKGISEVEDQLKSHYFHFPGEKK